MFLLIVLHTNYHSYNLILRYYHLKPCKRVLHKIIVLIKPIVIHMQSPPPIIYNEMERVYVQIYYIILSIYVLFLMCGCSSLINLEFYCNISCNIRTSGNITESHHKINLIVTFMYYDSICASIYAHVI